MEIIMINTKKSLMIMAMAFVMGTGFLYKAPVQAAAKAAPASASARLASKKAKAKTASSKENLANWLDVCNTLAKNLNKKGFRYSYTASSKSYQAALKHGKKSNCAMYVCWCLQEYGALKKGQTFYVKSGGGIRKRFAHWDKSKVSVIRKYKKVSSANLKPGDVVCMAKGNHACIYAGKNKAGQRLWFDAGRKNTYGKCIGSRYKNVGPRPWRYYNSRKVSYIIRIKDL